MEEKRLDPLEKQKARERIDQAERRRLKEIRLEKMAQDFQK